MLVPALVPIGARCPRRSTEPAGRAVQGLERLQTVPTVAMIDARDAGPRPGPHRGAAAPRRSAGPLAVAMIDARELVPALVPVKAPAAPRRSTAPPAVAMQPGFRAAAMMMQAPGVGAHFSAAGGTHGQSPKENCRGFRYRGGPRVLPPGKAPPATRGPKPFGCPFHAGGSTRSFTISRAFSRPPSIGRTAGNRGDARHRWQSLRPQ